MPSRTLLALALAATLATPTAVATWYGLGGSPEPDTERDRADGAMWEYPDYAGGGKVYFDAVLVSTGIALNPNNLDLDAEPGIVALPVALLGVWTDCNGDGFIGVAALGGLDYRAEMLLDDAICPQGSPHHYADDTGRWIAELRAIGPYADCLGCSDRYNPLLGRTPTPDLNDTQARVWGDFGLPGSDGLRTPKTSVDLDFTFHPRRASVAYDCDVPWCVPPGCVPGLDDRPICPPEPDPPVLPPDCDPTQQACPEFGGWAAGPALWVGRPVRLDELFGLDRLRVTAYADVGAAPSALLPPGGPFTYGSEACDGGGGNWECYPGYWQGDARVGDAYDLRDVDCYGAGADRQLADAEAC